MHNSTFKSSSLCHPVNLFSSKISATKHFNRMEMMRDRGIIYYPDASGRDTYIYNDDGGFNKIKEVRP